MNKCQAPTAVRADWRSSSVSFDIAPTRDQSPDHAASTPASSTRVTLPAYDQCCQLRNADGGNTAGKSFVLGLALEELVGHYRLYSCWQGQRKLASPACLDIGLAVLRLHAVQADYVYQCKY